MAGKADGTIRINTAIETDGFEAGGKEVEAAARRMSKKVSLIGASAKISLQKQTDAFVKQNQLYAQQEQKVENLRNKLKDLENQKIPTEEYKKLLSEMEKLDSEMDQITEKQKDMMSLGFSEEDAYKTVASDLERVSAAMDKVLTKKKQIEESGLSYKTPDTSSIEQKLVAEEQRAIQMNTALGTSYEALKAKVKSYGGEAKGLTKIKNTLNKAASKLVGSLKRAGSAMLGLNKKTKNARMSMGRMLAMSLMFSTVFRAISAVIGGIGEGIKNLSQYSADTNQSISSLMSALTRLKNSFATAFAPILNVVAPILMSFINMIARAVTYVGMLIATLTGQSSFVKATEVQEDYAASIADTAGNMEDAEEATKDAQKAAEKYLSPIDEINRYSSKDTAAGTTPSTGTPGYTAPTPSEMFETVPIESSISDMGEKIKNTFSQIFTPFKEAWNREGQATINAAKYAFSSLGALAKSVGGSIAEVWTNGTGTKMLSTMLQIAQNILNVIGNIVARIGEAWNKNEVGTRIVQNLANAFQKVLDFISRITKATAEWAANLDFYPLLESIANLTKSLSPLIETIGDILGDIYENTILPMIKYLIENGLPWITNKISELFEFLSENKWIIEAVGAALIAAFAAGVILPLILSIISGISGLISAISAIGTGIGVVVGVLGGPLTAAIAAVIAIGVLLIANWDKISKAASDLWKKVSKAFSDAGKAIASTAKSIWNGISSFLKNTFNSIKNSASTAFENMKTSVSNAWNAIKTGTSTTWNNIKSNVINVWNSMKSSASSIFGGIKSTVSNAWSNLKSTTSSVWGGIKSTVSSVWNNMGTMASNSGGKIQNAFVKAFKSISSLIKSPINAAISLINGLVSGVVSGINLVFSAFNRLHINIPSWVPGIGGKSLGFNFGYLTAPKIPYLATGAVIPPNAPFVAMLGDQKRGNNIEAPESLIRKIVREESGKQAVGNTYKVEASVGRRTLFEVVIEEAKLQQSATGKNPFSLT